MSGPGPGSYGEVFFGAPRDERVVSTPDGGSVSVPSFVEGNDYADNFGKQWSSFRDTQLDSRNGTSISERFLEDLLDAPLESLDGLTILEIGSGAGRFTEHLARHGALVVASDLSEAIYVNVGVGLPNVVAARLDMLHPPPMRADFDLVLCRGVLQHTPDPKAAIESLFRWVEPGGRVVFDIYGKKGISRLRPKYLWRPVIRRLFDFDSFGRLLDRWTPRLLRIRWKLKPFLPGPSRRILDYLIPIWDHKDTLPLSEEQLVEWSKLDTLDAMFATYDHPMSPSEVTAVLDTIGYQRVSIDRDRNFYRVDV